MSKVRKYPTELQEQIMFFDYVRQMIPKYPILRYANASLNGVRLTIGQSSLAKRSGLVKGYPDIFLPYNNGKYAGLFIELKRVKGGVISPEQKDFLKFLNEQGFQAVVCKGSKEAIDTLNEYLNIKI